MSVVVQDSLDILALVHHCSVVDLDTAHGHQWCEERINDVRSVLQESETVSSGLQR